ncbi:MAG: divalent metal cation transporter, partial [bacterium]|nr:divalent metal cation transporter [bacterium]
MNNWMRQWRRRIILALAIVGPGLITAFADNDAAGVSTYSVSAATFGYSVLIITIPMTILLAVT